MNDATLRLGVGDGTLLRYHPVTEGGSQAKHGCEFHQKAASFFVLFFAKRNACIYLMIMILLIDRR